MYKYTIYFKQLLRPIKLSTYIYIGLLYNAVGAWYDAKNKLIEYRKNNLTQYETKIIKDEWCAVRYGATEDSCDRFLRSIIWPVITITNLIPFMVLQLDIPSITETKTNVETSSTDKQ